MNLLLVTALVAGGVGRHVQMLVQGLVERGHLVVVACPRQVAEQFALEQLGARWWPLEVGSGPHPARDGRSLVRLRAVSRDADVVHAHGMRAGALAVLAGQGRPLVVTTHNAPPAGPASVGYAAMEVIVCRCADLVLGVSPDLVRRARQHGASAVGLAVVPAAPAAPMPREPARHRVLTELGELTELAEVATRGDPVPIGPATPLVVSVGRLARQKDMATVIAAVRRLSGRLPAGTEPVLLVAGDGPERPALEVALARARAEDGVRAVLLGHRDDVPTVLAAADVVVSAARWEGQPVWLQEALQQGAAVVATDVGGTGLVLGGAGLLVPRVPDATADDDLTDGLVAQRLAIALSRVILEPDLRERLRRQALARAAELPTAGEAVDAALTTYRDIAQESPPG